MTNRKALDWIYDVQAHARGAIELTSSATEQERQALAALLDVVSVEALEVRWTIKPWRKTGALVSGALKASLTQTCCVTLEPVAAEITEQIDVRLASDERVIGRDRAAARQVDIDPDGRDPPDLFDGNHIDLGKIAFEYLALGLDPYPKAPGVAFDGFETAEAVDATRADDGRADGGQAKDSRFSALARLAQAAETGRKN